MRSYDKICNFLFIINLKVVKLIVHHIIYFIQFTIIVDYTLTYENFHNFCVTNSMLKQYHPHFFIFTIKLPYTNV